MQRILLSWCVVAACVSGFAADMPAPTPTEAQIKLWVEQLNHEDFQTREDAEQYLKKAGATAIPYVAKAQESGDPEVKTRAQRVIDELSWAIKPDVTDLTALAPAGTVALLQTPNLKNAIAALRAQTTVGKLYDRAEMAGLKEAIGTLVVAETRMSDEWKKVILEWQDRFGGPNGFCYIAHDKSKEYPERDVFAALLGCNDPDPAKAFESYCKLFPVTNWQNDPVVNGLYKGVAYTQVTGQWYQETIGRAKNLIIRAQNMPSFKAIVDRASSTEGSLSSDPTYREAMSKIDAHPLASLYFNMGKLYEQAIQGDGHQGAFDAFGFAEWKYGAVGLYAKDGLVHERAFCKITGERRGLAKLLAFGPNSLKHAPLCPPDALAFLSIPADGKQMLETILTMAEKVDPRDTQRVKDGLTQMNADLGMNIEEALFGAIQGEAALWAMPPTGGALVPELAAAFQTKDEAKAKGMAEALAILLAGVTQQPQLTSTDIAGKTCWSLDKKLVYKDFPYSFTWCADGARVLAASSPEALKKLLERAASKAAGLDSQADFQKLLADVPPAERGGILYVNTAGLIVGMGPLAVSNLPLGESKDKLTAALKESWVKEIPGTLLTVATYAEGLSARSAGGLPITAVVPIGVFAAIAPSQSRRRAAASIEKAAPEAIVVPEPAE